MRIGIYSGSFDPIHIGHAIIAEYLTKTGLIDKLWLMVSKLNPLKLSSPPSSDAHRLKMAQIVAENTPNVEASDFELSLPSPSFSFKTLENLSKKFPDHEFILIIGADNWDVFDKWKNYKEILADYKIIIYPRPGINIETSSLPKNIVYLKDAPTMSVSSTLIRDSIAKGFTSRWLIPEEVREYIRANHLYI